MNSEVMRTAGPHDGHLSAADWKQVQAIVRKAERMRAEWFAHALGDVVAWLAKPAAVVFGPMLAERRRRQAIEDLMLLDDRMLEDIGVNRDQLYAVKDGDVALGDILPAPRPAAPRPSADVLTLPKRAPAEAGDDLAAAA